MRAAALLCLALPLLLPGCGKKGDLKPLEEESAAFTWPQQYPAPRTVVPADPLAEEEPVAGLGVTREFRRPDALPGRDPDRTTTTVHPAQ
ncbi:MAG: hypothetical protein WD100_03160 [Tistlia sp.]|uniref:hypothetical protein n=1 Tax=Tistlia sp. TaxID=3057121 RepID=UPI0034A27B1F